MNELIRNPFARPLHIYAYIFIFTVSDVNLHKKRLPLTPALVIP